MYELKDISQVGIEIADYFLELEGRHPDVVIAPNAGGEKQKPRIVSILLRINKWLRRNNCDGLF
ncbi:hypothetical protein BI350_15125 [Sporosarcina ureilytica]|uniref:Uncharacterized protein n=1 Tax=Sporosarcina ureilytica TaxID=298596 RepID=A0A1D8JJ64_9BACL|nr:hypothetical protein BI350_15125 [Sporosarcina ureilytica]